MKYIALFILITIFFASFVFAVDPTVHCWRQDISRVNDYHGNAAGFDESSGEFTTNASGYDYIVQPGTKYIVNGINEFTWECDDGASRDDRDFAVIWDRLEGKILKTNRGGTLGPLLVSSAACVKNGNYCYLYNGVEYPTSGSCSAGGTIGKGVDTSIDYTFTAEDSGEHILTAEIAVISPATENPYNSKILYKAIHGSRTKIFVGSPSMLIFGPEQNIIKGTYPGDNDANLTLLYTVMNRSFFDNRIVDYTVTCPSGITCIPDYTYRGWPIKAETEITIPVRVIIPNNKVPINIAINLELDFSANDLTDCDPTADGNYCHTQAQPTTIKLGLLDQQDFQVKSIDTADEQYCVGLDGIVGFTGEEYAPKVNLTFGNNTDPLISIDECDELDISKNENPDGVYCSQLEFAFELAEKINSIADLRERIQQFESIGDYTDATVLRKEENNYTSFSAYLRAQDFANIITSISSSDNYFAQTTGLQTWWSAIEQKSYLEKLYNASNGVEFKIMENGLLVEQSAITPGVYNVRIDMNELGEITTSNYLFPNGNLNPTLNINVYLEKERSPRLNWFFYQQGYEDDFEDIFNGSDVVTATNAYSTNVQNRGEIIKFNEADGDLTEASFFETYAYPLFVVVSGNSAGDTNTEIKLNDAGDLTPDFIGKDMLTYWTGFASTKGNGRETTAQNPLNTFLPYRMPDARIGTNLFNFSDVSHNLTKVVLDSKMLMSTVLYLPYEDVSTENLLLQTPMQLYHPQGSCTTPPCTLNLTESMSQFKADDLSEVIEGINDSSICIYQEIGSSQENKWTLFWNEQEILKELTNQIHTIDEITVCGEDEVNIQSPIVTPPEDPPIEMCYDSSVDFPVPLDQIIGLDDSRLVGYWPFDNDLKNAAGNVINGEAKLGAIETTDAKFGNAYSFDGTNDRLNFSYDSSLSLEAFTISAWIKSSALQKGTIIAREENPTTDATNYLLGIREDNGNFYLNCHFETGSIVNNTDEDHSLRFPINNLDNYTHVACSYKNGNWKLYINGEDVNSATGQSNLPVDTGSREINVGVQRLHNNSDRDWGDYYKGVVDELALFNDALTPCEIKKLAKGTDGCLANCSN